MTINTPETLAQTAADTASGSAAAVLPAVAPGALTLDAAAMSWLAAGRPFAEALIIEATSSAPVPIGGRMLIADEETFLGSVSGGCIEADVIAAAMDVLETGTPRIETFGISEDRAWRSGLPCGATIRVFIARPGASGLRAAAEAAERLRRDRRPCVVATDLTTAATTVFDDPKSAPEAVADALASGTSAIADCDGKATFLHVLKPPPRIVAIGATHIAQILETMVKAIGYDIIVIDPRSAFTSATRFTPETAITGWPDEKLTPFGDDPYTAIVTLTHIGHIDDEALKIALASSCRYIGALGSRRTHAARCERLRADGFSDADLARIHAPIGFDLGGRAPGEIATAILAEIVAAFNGKSDNANGQSLKNRGHEARR